MEGGKTLMFSACFCFPADPCGWHHQEHAGVRDRAGGGHRPRITGYGLLSGSWTPLYHVWEAGKKPHQTTLLGNFLAWPCNGWQNLAWNSQSENNSYKRALCCIKNLMIVLRNHCIYTLMEIIEGLGHRPWGEKTPPSVALCGPCPAGYVTRSCCRICCVPRCSPPPFKLWLHLPPTWIGVGKCNAESFGSKRSIWRSWSFSETRWSGVWDTACWGAGQFYCDIPAVLLVFVLLKILPARDWGRASLGVQHGIVAGFSRVLDLKEACSLSWEN